MIRSTRLLTSLLLLGVATYSFAQTEEQLPSLAIDTPCVFTGVFEQSKTLEGVSSKLKSNGSFYYHCALGVVWKSQRPVSETLIFRKDGKAFTFDEQGQASAIKSRQGKVIGRLLNDLIGADFAQLAKTFDLEQLNSSTVRFTPRQRRLRRAFSIVEMAVSSEDMDAVAIKIIDRNAQTTQVSARQTAILVPQANEAQLIKKCSELNTFSHDECELLLRPDAQLSTS